MIEEDEQKFGNLDSDNDHWFTIEVESQNTVWVLRRSYENARTLDHQLHKCVYDRKFSLLPELQPIPNECENPIVSIILFIKKVNNLEIFIVIIIFTFVDFCKRPNKKVLRKIISNSCGKFD